MRPIVMPLLAPFPHSAMYAEGSQEAGYMPAQIEKMTSGNVIRVLRAAEGAGQEGRLSP